MTTKETSKYSDQIRNNKIKIPLPNLDKLKVAVDKDIKKLDKEIDSWQSKIDLKNFIFKSKEQLLNSFENDLKNIDDLVEEYKVWIEQAADFFIIKSRLEKIVKDFPTIVKEIEVIWTNPMKSDSEDKYRVAEPFYSIEFSNGWEDFYQVGSDRASKCGVFGFVQKTMHNTLEYLGKFGTLTCVAGSDCEILETNSCHPWFEEIYKIDNRSSDIAVEAAAILAKLGINQ